VPSQWLRQLVDDWLEFDVAGFETRLNRLAHYGVDIGGLRIHDHLDAVMGSTGGSPALARPWVHAGSV
jgi:Epoxide hydrolase N terminus